ncbi:MAG: molybdopterin-dependent oxidoreductase [Pseudomonadota bacterium]
MKGSIQRTAMRAILMALGPMFARARKKSRAFAEEMRKHDCVYQIRLRDGSVGRYYEFTSGQMTSKAGVHPSPDASMIFKNVETALKMLSPKPDMLYRIHAAKNFLVTLEGSDTVGNWMAQLVQRAQREAGGFKYGQTMPDGSKRYTMTTNGGPVHVYVEDGRITRTTPIIFDQKDAPSWTVKARGKEFTPRRLGAVAPHALSTRGMVYSKNRILHPMKRVDYDPEGERNVQNRGVSGYERISWDEALDLVAKEMKRQKREYGPGSIFMPTSSHQMWGNIGYYISAHSRFCNLIGGTRMLMNPDSWEGWYWGATHHYGNTLKVGMPSSYGTLEDCLEEAEQIVFWSSDPESTNGAYAGLEATERRQWARDIGIEFVHIDPHHNPTAQLFGGKWIPIKPTTDAALAIAIMHVWITEGLFDETYVREKTTGFDEWRAYVLGEEDGVPKTPEWQEGETGVPAHIARALARSWGRKKTYLSCGAGGIGFGGANRGSNGTQWARCMVMMMAMQGWGKPGVNFGNLSCGAPLDFHFYFPGYAEGGISGDLNNSSNPINNYQRMPHVVSMSPIKQVVPKQKIPEAIIDGHADGYLWDCTSQEAQFTKVSYPAPGFSPIRMIYRFGGSIFSTGTKSGRWIDAYRHESIDCVVNQSIFMEGEALFADVILPACTNFERWDIGEWGNAGGYGHHSFEMLNHRIIALQHKCIEPLGESKSDYQIFAELLERFDLGQVFTEGCSELDWCKRVFDSSDLPDRISWKEFCEKGYYVVAPEEEVLRPPVAMRWFAEGRKKDLPEAMPLPSQYADRFGEGLQTPSGKFEFVPTTLRRMEKEHPDRPAVNRYTPSWEGPRAIDLSSKYPLQMVSTHSRYSFHTHVDNTSFTDQIADHRALIDGHYFWLLRMSPEDAAKRGIGDRDLVKVFNDRGSVICAADVSAIIGAGSVKGYQSSAKFNLVTVGNETVEIGGCLNMLTPDRPQVGKTHSMSPNSTLVEVERFEHREALLNAKAA